MSDVFKELERIRQEMEERGAEKGCFYLLKNSNLPPTLLLAAFKNIPPGLFGKVLHKIGEQKKDFDRLLFYGFIGKPGRGKTLCGVRLYSYLLFSGEKRKPLFMTSFDLEDFARGRIQLHRFATANFDTISWFENRGTEAVSEEIIPFSQLTRRYDLILVDDVSEETVSHFEKLILQAYTTDTVVIFTSNIDLLELVSPRAKSRLIESCLFVDFDEFEYLRGIGGER